MVKAATPAKKSPPRKKKSDGREVKYPQITAEVLQGDTALTIEQTMEILGWEEEPEGADWGSDHCEVVSNLYGKKVRLHNNGENRPLIPADIKLLKQEHLQGNWRLNGESMVIGRTALVLSAQHRGIAHILAEKERLENIEHWKKTLPDPIRMATVIVYGVEETDDVFRTLNTGKPASAGDTLYRSRFLFSVPTKYRKVVAKTLERAVGVLWHRLGYDRDQWAPIRSNAMVHEFIESHKTLVDCAVHLCGENGDSAISGIVPLGTASALMYLQAMSSSDFDTYHDARFKGNASEKKLSPAYYEKAADFWVGLAHGGPELQAVREKIAGYVDLGMGNDAKEAVLCLAWALYLAGEEITEKVLKVKLTKADENDRRYLDENYTMGGIDMGDPEEKKEEKAEEQTTEKAEPAAPAASPRPKTKFSTVELDALHEKHPDTILLFKDTDAEVTYILGDDAKIAAPILVLDYDDASAKLKRISFPLDQTELQAGNLVRVGKKVALVSHSDHNDIVVVKKPKKVKSSEATPSSDTLPETPTS